MSRSGTSATSRHSSVERFIGPDATITLDFALARLTGVIDKLLVYPERMQRNLDRMGGLVHSQRVLLALTQAGLSREDAYALVQRNAMKVWESDGALSLLDLLKADPGGHRAPRPAADRGSSSTSITISGMSTRFSPASSALSKRFSRRATARLCCGSGHAGNLAAARPCEVAAVRLMRRARPRMRASSRRLPDRAVARLDHRCARRKTTRFPRRIARKLIEEPLSRFVRAQALH